MQSKTGSDKQGFGWLSLIISGMLILYLALDAGFFASHAVAFSLLASVGGLSSVFGLVLFALLGLSALAVFLYSLYALPADDISQKQAASAVSVGQGATATKTSTNPKERKSSHSNSQTPDYPGAGEGSPELLLGITLAQNLTQKFEAAGSSGFDVLLKAVESGDEEGLIKRLKSIEKLPDEEKARYLECSNQGGQTPLQLAYIKKPCNVNMVELLLEAGAKSVVSSRKGFIPLMRVVLFRQFFNDKALDLLQVLLEASDIKDALQWESSG